MKRKFRLTRKEDFKRVRRYGKSYAHPLIVLVAMPNELDRSRFGVAAGKSVGNAVKRNRAKRILREQLRLHLRLIQKGWDVILISRRNLIEASSEDTEQALIELLQRAGLYEKGFDER